ncbi:MAG: hypothetical protein BWY88_01273 [Synergistetes bacterium ADurb.Bin520]|nr:MAG: hypothetical protein BWY88_01273 [Synergistetes bacterium ADurb.Bin520]
MTATESFPMPRPGATSTGRVPDQSPVLARGKEFFASTMRRTEGSERRELSSSLLPSVRIKYPSSAGTSLVYEAWRSTS